VTYLDEKPVGHTEKVKFKNLKTYKLWDGSGASIKKTKPVVKVEELEARFEAPRFDEDTRVN
jgi:hypothetical protein